MVSGPDASQVTKLRDQVGDLLDGVGVRLVTSSSRVGCQCNAIGKTTSTRVVAVLNSNDRIMQP